MISYTEIVIKGVAMISIIKHGKKRICKCSDCECEFTYEQEDTFYDGQREEYTVVKCPDCGKRIIVG